jgi:DtxR family Mn-dependent transcriptional regulator
VKHLEMQLEVADSLACRLEHLTSEDVADRLSKFLDNPVVCFHGSPIYPAEHQVEGERGFALSEAEVGKPFQVQRVVGDEHTRTFLAEQGLYPGSSGSVIAISSSGSALLQITPEIHITVNKQVCDQVLVIYRE